MKKKHPLDKWKKTKTPTTARVVAGDKEAKDLTLVKHKKHSAREFSSSRTVHTGRAGHDN